MVIGVCMAASTDIGKQNTERRRHVQQNDVGSRRRRRVAIDGAQTVGVEWVNVVASSGFPR